MTCKYCPSMAFYYIFVPMKNNNMANKWDVKYKFAIGRLCCNCHKSFDPKQVFVPQTEELMAELDHAVLMPKFNLQDRELPFEK